jgi:hypothetical protein
MVFAKPGCSQRQIIAFKHYIAREAQMGIGQEKNNPARGDQNRTYAKKAGFL